MSARSGELRVGTSGFQYDHWLNVFYPEDLPWSQWLEYYAARFDTVELNVTFYRLPSLKTFESWRRRAPKNFLYAVKFSKYATHQKRLAEQEETIDAFLAGAEHLDEFLGPILVQLPPYWRVNAERLNAFLEVAPKRHRWTVEFREPSWLTGEVYEVLKRHRAALCIHDKLDDHPWELTADWTYLRFHGPDGGNRKKYSSQKLLACARKVARLLAEGVDVYAYFNNDLEGHAVEDALTLRRYVEKELQGHA
jgi:uncharacterized protein YecE (DUF72 family)